MTTDPRDTAIGVSCPVVAVPLFGALEPHASGQRMLLARNGLFVQMKTPWLDCTTRVAEVGMHLPYGAAVNAGQKPPLFAGEVAVLMHGRFSRTVPAGLA